MLAVSLRFVSLGRTMNLLTLGVSRALRLTLLTRRSEIMMAPIVIGPALLHLTAIRIPLLGCRQGTIVRPCIVANCSSRCRVSVTGSGTSLGALAYVHLNTSFRLFVFRVLRGLVSRLHCLL